MQGQGGKQPRGGFREHPHSSRAQPQPAPASLRPGHPSGPAPCPRPPSQTNPRRKRSLNQQGYLSAPSRLPQSASHAQNLPWQHLRGQPAVTPLCTALPAATATRAVSCPVPRPPAQTRRLRADCTMSFSRANYREHLAGEVLGVPGTGSFQKNLSWTPCPSSPTAPNTKAGPVWVLRGKDPTLPWL